MKIFSCCKSSPVVELGGPTELKPEAAYWKLVCAQRLEHFFMESSLPFPSYLQTTIQEVTKLITSDDTDQAIIY